MRLTVAQALVKFLANQYSERDGVEQRLIPGTFGEWVMKLMPGNAGPGVVVPVSFGEHMLDPWTGFAVYVAEITAVALAGLVVFSRRDA